MEFLVPSPVLAVVVSWEVNQQIEGISLSLPYCLPFAIVLPLK